MKRLIMTDFDGVVVDSLELLGGSFIKASHDYGYEGLKDLADFLKLFAGNIYESLQKDGLTMEEVDKITDRCIEYQSAGMQELKMFSGMKDAMNKVAEQFPFYVITSNYSQEVLDYVAGQGVEGILGVMGAESEKSKVKKIQKVMAEYPGYEAYYIGDTQGDMIEGKKAGAKTVGVSWGWHSAEKLSQAGADMIASSPNDLAEIFDK